MAEREPTEQGAVVRDRFGDLWRKNGGAWQWLTADKPTFETTWDRLVGINGPMEAAEFKELV